MRNYSDAFHHLRQSLQSLYDTREAAAIAHEVLFCVTGMSKLQRLTDKEGRLTRSQDDQLQRYTTALQLGKPMQYVLGHVWFMGRQFCVDERVLIPRPETEELVQWVVDDTAGVSAPCIHDMGTGSGCIAISLKALLPDAVVTACDVSAGALQVAQENASALDTEVHFLHCDMLSAQAYDVLEMYDVLVSNPPYIPPTERDTLAAHVKNFEPSIALFTPDADPLIFYRRIAEIGLSHLRVGGTVFCELHRDFASATAELFRVRDYEVLVRNDMHGNPRMLKAVYKG